MKVFDSVYQDVRDMYVILSSHFLKVVSGLIRHRQEQLKIYDSTCPLYS